MVQNPVLPELSHTPSPPTLPTYPTEPRAARVLPSVSPALIRYDTKYCNNGHAPPPATLASIHSAPEGGRVGAVRPAGEERACGGGVLRPRQKLGAEAEGRFSTGEGVGRKQIIYVCTAMLMFFCVVVVFFVLSCRGRFRTTIKSRGPEKKAGRQSLVRSLAML